MLFYEILYLIPRGLFPWLLLIIPQDILLFLLSNRHKIQLKLTLDDIPQISAQFLVALGRDDLKGHEFHSKAIPRLHAGDEIGEFLDLLRTCNLSLLVFLEDRIKSLFAWFALRVRCDLSVQRIR